MSRLRKIHKKEDTWDCITDFENELAANQFTHKAKNVKGEKTNDENNNVEEEIDDIPNDDDYNFIENYIEDNDNEYIRNRKELDELNKIDILNLKQKDKERRDELLKLLNVQKIINNKEVKASSENEYSQNDYTEEEEYENSNNGVKVVKEEHFKSVKKEIEEFGDFDDFLMNNDKTNNTNTNKVFKKAKKSKIVKKETLGNGDENKDIKEKTMEDEINEIDEIFGATFEEDNEFDKDNVNISNSHLKRNTAQLENNFDTNKHMKLN